MGSCAARIIIRCIDAYLKKRMSQNKENWQEQKSVQVYDIPFVLSVMSKAQQEPGTRPADDSYNWGPL